MNRFDPLNPRYHTALAHLVFGVVCIIRPNLDLIVPTYEPFQNMFAWGVGMILLSLVIIMAPRGSAVLLGAHLVSSFVLFTIAALLTVGVGLLPTAGLVVTFGLVSLLLFGRTLQQLLVTWPWFVRHMDRPPAWFRRPRGDDDA